MSEVIDLRSDTVTQPTAPMRDAMAAAEVGDDVYGEDPTVNRLEEMAAELLGKEASLFVPTGTMANAIGVRLNSEPGAEIIIDSRAHIYNYECAGASQLSGVQFRTIPSERGVLDAGAVEEAIRPNDIHAPVTTAVAIENTHNLGGGSVWSLAEISSIAEVTQRHKIRLHVDGARLLNAATAGGYTAAEASATCNTVTLCLSKGLGAPLGSLIAGTKDDMKRARRVRKLLGGGMRQVGIVAAAGIYALEHHVDRLAEDHANARRLFEKLSALGEFAMDGAVVETNIIVFSTRRSPAWTQALVDGLAQKGVLIGWRGGSAMRAVTNLGVTQADIDRAVDVVSKVIAELGNESPKEGT